MQTLSIAIKFLHHIGIWLWICSLFAYILLRYKNKDFLTEGYRLYFKRRFTGLAIFGFVLIFGSGMAMLISEGYVGSARGNPFIPLKMIWKFSLSLLILICGIMAWGIDVGITKRVDELKILKQEISSDFLYTKIGKLNKLLNIFIFISFFLSFVVFLISLSL